jgi:hypothetical protein
MFTKTPKPGRGFGVKIATRATSCRRKYVKGRGTVAIWQPTRDAAPSAGGAGYERLRGVRQDATDLQRRENRGQRPEGLTDLVRSRAAAWASSAPNGQVFPNNTTVIWAEIE